jgi:hypothetical protein
VAGVLVNKNQLEFLNITDEIKCRICEREFYSSQGRSPVGRPVVHHLIPKQKYREKSRNAPIIHICSI